MLRASCSSTWTCVRRATSSWVFCVEAVAAAIAVEPQQVIAQQRQFFLLAQRTHTAVGERGRNMGEVHILKLL